MTAHPERPLPLDVAARIISSCFDDVDVSSIRHIGSGWEFDAFVTRDQWVFRFPRDAESERIFEIEARVHQLVGPSLPRHVSLPRVERVGIPTTEFPYRVAAHRFIPGVPADQVSDPLIPVVAREIGELLGAIHSIPEALARAAGISVMDVDEEGRKEWLEHGVHAAHRLIGIDPMIDGAIEWLRQTALEMKLWNGPFHLIHHDLSTDHVLVNPGTGLLTGVLDWTDVILGDPARDFVFLGTWRGWSFVEQVLQHYPLDVDNGFRHRLHTMARLLSTIWLALAVEQGAEPHSHIQGVRNVFASGCSEGIF